MPMPIFPSPMKATLVTVCLSVTEPMNLGGGAGTRVRGDQAVAPPSSAMKSRRFTALFLPCFPRESIAHATATAALRDFNLAYVCCGSFASDGYSACGDRMSASRPKADK
jgi:hypothetical protein